MTRFIVTLVMRLKILKNYANGSRTVMKMIFGIRYRIICVMSFIAVDMKYQMIVCGLRMCGVHMCRVVTSESQRWLRQQQTRWLAKLRR